MVSLQAPVFVELKPSGAKMKYVVYIPKGKDGESCSNAFPSNSVHPVVPGPIANQEKGLTVQDYGKEVVVPLTDIPTTVSPRLVEEIEDASLKDGFVSDGFTLVISKMRSKKEKSETEISIPWPQRRLFGRVFPPQLVTP